jgi:hypothetical protein
MTQDDYKAYLASREWALKREAVKERGHGFCERCKVGPHEATHHKTYANIGNEPIEDLQAICNECHEFESGKSDYDPVEDVVFIVLAINKTHFMKTSSWPRVVGPSDHARFLGKLADITAVEQLTVNPHGADFLENAKESWL